jgi:hypothetical protein
MPQTEFAGLPIIDTEESEGITVAVKAEDIAEGDEFQSGTAPDSNRTSPPARH